MLTVLDCLESSIDIVKPCQTSRVLFSNVPGDSEGPSVQLGNNRQPRKNQKAAIHDETGSNIGG